MTHTQVDTGRVPARADGKRYIDALESYVERLFDRALLDGRASHKPLLAPIRRRPGPGWSRSAQRWSA
jgi:hypothetical protein